MIVYLLHFTPAFKHAKHYIGWTCDTKPTRRVKEHKNGTYRCTPLVKAAIAAGCTIKLACVWPDADRNFERQLKNRKNASKICPCCNSKKYHKPQYKPKEKKDETEN